MSRSTDRPPPTAARAPLWGLALCGGFGSRLGRDKGTLEYHGRPQAAWLHALLKSLCDEAFVSIRPDQAASEPYLGLPAILDRPGVQGPAAGLLAAWDHAPHAAWLLVAADLPLVDRPLLETLIASRAVIHDATAFRHADGTPEPLCAIWEPAAHGRVEAELPNVSLRRVLDAGKVTFVPAAAEQLRSVNTRDDDERVRALLRRRQQEGL